MVNMARFVQEQKYDDGLRNLVMADRYSHMKAGILVMAISLSQVACSVFGIRSEENPKYEVLFQEENKEIRLYAPYVIAKTPMKDDSNQSRNEAFRVLAGYIFGGNEKKQSLSMTAPVTRQASKVSETISMTAPVTQQKSGEDLFMTFMMPSKYKIADLPIPRDNRIAFEEVPSKLIGSIRYSGLGRSRTNKEKETQLKEWILAQGKYQILSEPIWAGYDPPWTIPFLRRLEMMFEIKAKK